jgi:DNA mismatch endonuclease (patch repair protein)
MDNLSPKNRQKCMSRIKSKNTRPEMLVRRILTDMGIRYRLHKKNLPGKPDVVIGKRKVIIFINGCFWHQHLNCKYAVLPKTNVDYWKNKLQCNVMRQATQIDALKQTGWHVYILWECQLKSLDNAKKIIENIFENE